MLRIRSHLAAIPLIAALGCQGQKQDPLPHPSATLLAGVIGHLETCKLLLADSRLTPKDVIDFASIGMSFARDKSARDGAPAETVALLAQRQAELQVCVQELDKRVGIKAVR